MNLYVEQKNMLNTNNGSSSLVELTRPNQVSSLLGFKISV